VPDYTESGGSLEHLKKCPGCRSISSDEKTTCGVCGESLVGVSPMHETLEQSIREDEARKSLEDKQRMDIMARVDALRLAVGLAVGLVVLGFGIFLVNFDEIIWGFLLLPIGIVDNRVSDSRRTGAE